MPVLSLRRPTSLMSVSDRSAQSPSHQTLNWLLLCEENWSYCLHHMFRPKQAQLVTAKISLIPCATNVMTVIKTHPSYVLFSISILLLCFWRRVASIILHVLQYVLVKTSTSIQRGGIVFTFLTIPNPNKIHDRSDMGCTGLVPLLHSKMVLVSNPLARAREFLCSLLVPVWVLPLPIVLRHAC